MSVDSPMKDKKKRKSLEGKVWSGFIGECKDKCPCYLLRPKMEAIFICDILRKFARKKVRITIQEL